MDDSPARRKLCPISRRLGSTANYPLSALTHQNLRAGRSASGHCSYLPTTQEQRKQVVGVVAPMSPTIRDEGMTERGRIQGREEQANRYASREDFQTIFSEHLTELYQLSFLLTRDPARAERCFVSGIEDCVTENRVFREGVRSWAKRTIVQNAIRELKPRPGHSNSPLSEAIFPKIGQLWSGPGGHFAMDAVLGLEDFERFVFVMPVLEHYSEHECGLLLGCSAREVREARGRALEELMDSSHMESFAESTVHEHKR
jgi:DNA-directed RNA polymerase specialized sigma24 family protein